MVKGKRGWIRIVEAFVAILLIAGTLLIVINKGYIGQDNSEKIYTIEKSILREIQLDSELRNEIIELNLSQHSSGIEYNVDNPSGLFPQNVIERVNQRKPDYLDCVSKICYLEKVCALDNYPDSEVYSQSVAISTDLETYDPKQLKLFCWMN